MKYELMAFGRKKETLSEGEETVFVCHFGLERSKAAAEGLTDAGLPASHFAGGTRKLVNLSINEIKDTFSNKAEVVLIFDPGSRDGETDRKDQAVDLLKKASVSHRVVGTPNIVEMLRENGKDINDYLL